MPSLVELLIGLGGAAFILCAWKLGSLQRHADLRAARQLADAQFFALQRGDFQGLHAVILKDEERSWSSEGGLHYELTRYAANAAGEVFMFIYDPEGKPFFKPVEPRIAKVVLGDRYTPAAR